MISVPDVEGEPFWQGLQRGQVVVQACRACGRRWIPRLPGCPYCRAQEITEVTAPGTGTVYSWIRVHREIGDASSGDVPYVVATVDLDAGGRVFGQLDPPDRAAIGLRVAPQLAPRDGWTELRFTPTDQSSDGGVGGAGGRQ
jgi:uncharacterized OB-fold protein